MRGFCGASVEILLGFDGSFSGALLGIARTLPAGLTTAAPAGCKPLPKVSPDFSEDSPRLLQMIHQGLSGVLSIPGGRCRSWPGGRVPPDHRMRVLPRGSAGYLRRIYQALQPGGGGSTEPRNQGPFTTKAKCGSWHERFTGDIPDFCGRCIGLLRRPCRGFVEDLPNLRLEK